MSLFVKKRIISALLLIGLTSCGQLSNPGDEREFMDRAVNITSCTTVASLLSENISSLYADDAKKYSELVMRTYADHYCESAIADYLVCRRVNRDQDIAAQCGTPTNFRKDEFEQCTSSVAALTKKLTPLIISRNDEYKAMAASSNKPLIEVLEEVYSNDCNYL